jgi:hypothetical protein
MRDRISLKAMSPTTGPKKIHAVSQLEAPPRRRRCRRTAPGDLADGGSQRNKRSGTGPCRSRSDRVEERRHEDASHERGTVRPGAWLHKVSTAQVLRPPKRSTNGRPKARASLKQQPAPRSSPSQPIANPIHGP